MAKVKIQQNEISIEILTEVLRCCQEIGNNSTLLVLKQAQDIVETTKIISIYIIDIVCKELNVSKFNLFKRSGYGDKTIAIMFIYILHKSHLGYDIGQIENTFNKKYKTIWASIKRFENLMENHPSDLKILKKFNSINDLIINQIKKISNA